MIDSPWAVTAVRPDQSLELWREARPSGCIGVLRLPKGVIRSEIHALRGRCAELYQLRALISHNAYLRLSLAFRKSLIEQFSRSMAGAAPPAIGFGGSGAFETFGLFGGATES